MKILTYIVLFVFYFVGYYLIYTMNKSLDEPNSEYSEDAKKYIRFIKKWYIMLYLIVVIIALCMMQYG